MPKKGKRKCIFSKQNHKRRIRPINRQEYYNRGLSRDADVHPGRQSKKKETSQSSDYIISGLKAKNRNMHDKLYRRKKTLKKIRLCVQRTNAGLVRAQKKKGLLVY